jgi:HK97 family phage portal protein
MDIQKVFSRFTFNPFSKRDSAAYGILPIGFEGWAGKAYRYETYAVEGYQINSVVFSCIGKIIQAMQSVDWAWEKADEIIEPDKLPPQLKILDTLLANPDPYTNHDEFLAEYMLHMLIGGISFLRVINVRPDGEGSARLGFAPELLLERPDKVEIKTQGRQVVGFKVQRTAGFETYTPDEMTFIRLMNPLTHLNGQSPMQAAALEIDSLNAGRKLSTKTLEDGGVLKAIIALKGQRNVDESKMQEIIGKFWERFDTARKEGKPMVFSGDGADYHTLSQTMSELDWTSNEGIMARRICNVFNIPSQMLGDPDTSKYSNYQEAQKDFYINNILPQTNMLQGKLNHWLVPMYDKIGYKLVPDTAGVQVLQEDEAKLAAWLTTASWMTDNEKRERMGMERIEDPAADELRLPAVTNPFAPVRTVDKTNEKRAMIQALDHVDTRSKFRTEESRRNEFRRRDSIRRRKENLYLGELRKYFTGQRNRLIDSFVNATGGKRSTRAGAEDMPLLFPVESTFVDDTFRRLKENAKYVEDLNELTRGIVVEFGQDAIDQFLADGTLFEINRPSMQKFIADDMFARSELINGTQADELQSIITDGYNKGLSQDGIANLIQDKYEEISAGRAKTIARTEVGRSAGIATQEGYAQAGVQYREWLSARDANVRDDHVFMDGQVQALDDEFVGPEGQTSMTVPPESGDAGFDINCRCVSVALETRDDAI